MQFTHGPIGHIDAINHRWRGGDQLEVKFTGQTLTDNFHMQQAQEPATETKPQSSRGFGFERKRTVIQAEFFQRIAQIAKFPCINGEKTTEHH